ncbi:MAG: hypothetical protein H8E37_13625 [Planctomycetes bacterium]|nr:hypothetical protein [Planctomycetota bacterium]
MRALAALLVVSTAFASADAQLAPVVTGPSVSQSQRPGTGPGWRGYSRGSYSRSTAPARPSYSQPAHRTPSQYQRSTWRPRATHYSNRGYGQSQISQPAPTAGTIQTPPGVPTPFGNPQVGGQPQSQQPAVSQPAFGAGFGTPYVDKVRQAAAEQTEQPLTPEEQQAKDRKVREEQWRQFQIQEAQRQAYFQRYGDPASQRFWRDIYSYNRSTYNQNMNGYTFYGQNRAGQNMYGYSNHNQSRGGQVYSQPGFHNQSRFNQGPPIYNFHNIIVPGAGHWRY